VEAGIQATLAAFLFHPKQRKTHKRRLTMGAKNIKLPRRARRDDRRSGKSATRQQALFYRGFVALFGWQHCGNGWQHVAAFLDYGLKTQVERTQGAIQHTSSGLARRPRRRTQIKNSFSASALICVICEQRPFLSFFCGKNLFKQDCQTRPLGTRSQDRQKSRDRRKLPAASQRQTNPRRER